MSEHRFQCVEMSAEKMRKMPNFRKFGSFSALYGKKRPQIHPAGHIFILILYVADISACWQ
jgi:hypothetical protein